MAGFGVFTSKNYAGTDQGVDFSGAGPIPALDQGVVTDVGTSHIRQGYTVPYVIYKLTAGPYKGHDIYVAENFKPAVKVGDHLKQGQSVGSAVGQYPFIEVGFNQTDKGWSAYGTLDGPQPQGRTMWNYIKGLINAGPPVTSAGGGGFFGAISDVNSAIEGVATGQTQAGAVAGATGLPNPFTAIKDIGSALSFLFSVRGLQTIGGGILVLMGLYLLARQIGLPSATTVIPGPAGAVARAVPNPVGPSENPSGARPARTRVTNQYYLEEPPSTRRRRMAAAAGPSEEIPF